VLRRLKARPLSSGKRGKQAETLSDVESIRERDGGGRVAEGKGKEGFEQEWMVKFPKGRWAIISGRARREEKNLHVKEKELKEFQ